MKPVLCSINPSLFWSTNSTGSSTDHESLEMPWFNLWEEQSPGGSGSRRAPPELLYWELVGQRKTLSASRRRERANLGWPLLREERDWQVWDKQQLQTAPCSLLGGKVLRPSLTPHPSSFYHTMSVWGPQKRTGGWVFLGWIFLFFSGECFCYLPVPCETSHTAPTAAELLFFTASPSPGDESLVHS